jgi:ABC-2 type transport system ATP-binding protein
VAAVDALAVEARAVVFSYGERRALDAISLSVPSGAVFGLLGPNGSGKSTLLSLLAGLRTPDEGLLRVFGQAPTPVTRRAVGFVFQESCLDPLMTVEETLRLQGRLFGLGGSRLREVVADLLRRFDLADRAGDATGALSGGMGRRLELARALVSSPGLLVLDEPTVGLDPDSRRRFWSDLGASNEAGTTILVATNDVAEADRYCRTVAFLDRGRVVAEGAPADLKRDLKKDSVRLDFPDPPEGLFDAVARWPGVGRVTVAPSSVHVTVDSASSFVPRLFEACGNGIRSIRIEESTLEDAYFQIVGRPLSDGAMEGQA